MFQRDLNLFSPTAQRHGFETRPLHNGTRVASESSLAASASAYFANDYESLRADIVRSVEQGFESLPAPPPSAQGHERHATQQDPHPLQLQTQALHEWSGVVDGRRRHFLTTIEPWAQQAGAELGVSTDLVLAHAILESGWGQRSIPNHQGSASHNLFGIKAGSRWNGSVVEALTTEYIRGEEIKLRDQFRAYPDYAAAFSDYVALLKGHARYAAVLNTGNDARAFARALSRSGYATDAAYEDKLVRIAQQIQTMRLAPSIAKK